MIISFKLISASKLLYLSQANFFLINVNRDANAVFEKFIKQGIIVRSMASYGLPEHIRVNVGLHEENIRFVEVLEKIIAE